MTLGTAHQPLLMSGSVNGAHAQLHAVLVPKPEQFIEVYLKNRSASMNRSLKLNSARQRVGVHIGENGHTFRVVNAKHRLHLPGNVFTRINQTDVDVELMR